MDQVESSAVAALATADVAAQEGTLVAESAFAHATSAFTDAYAWPVTTREATCPLDPELLCYLGAEVDETGELKWLDLARLGADAFAGARHSADGAMATSAEQIGDTADVLREVSTLP